MRFSFIHTSDWQIGKRFGGFDDRLAGRLEAARLDAIDRIAQVAGAHGARHVLVAGDVYDAPSLSEKTLRQALSRMSQHRSLTWVLLAGNHDPAGPGSVWSRVRQIGPGETIIVADQPKPIELGEGVVVLPAPLAAKALSHDPTAWMDEAGPLDNAIRIGLAHGAVHGFGSEGESAVPIDPARVDRAQLDYLALGDWHGMKRISERCWYSGTPEPDNFANTAKGHVLAVTLSAHGGGARAEIDVKAVATGHFGWERLEAQVNGAAEIPALGRQISGLAEQSKHLLLSLRLSGALTLSDQAALETFRADLDSRLAHLDWRDRDVRIADGPADELLEGLVGDDGELRAVARRLMERARADGDAGDDAHADAALARTALLRLMAFARDDAEGGA